MIRINLLPHREAKRKQKQTAFAALMVLGALAGAAVVLTVGGYNAARIAVQNERNLVLKQSNEELDRKISKIANLKSEIEALKARQQAVEDLQGDRNQPVYLLDELVRQTPEGVYLKSFKQDGQRVTLTGTAQSQERVAEFLRNLSGNSPWLEHPDLTDIHAVALAQSRTGQKVMDFTLAVSIKRARENEDNAKPGEPGKARPAAAGAAGKAS
jgi:type IV pilus assembly protein PilN